METMAMQVIHSKDAVDVVRDTLRRVDPRLVNHGDRVAYILFKMLSGSARYNRAEVLEICILGIFHDIGAYKTDEINKMFQFETSDVWEHSIYGYLFLKYLSPLSEHAEAILYHHYDYDQFDEGVSSCRDIALMISLADRIDVAIHNRGNHFSFAEIEHLSGKKFDPAHVALFKEKDQTYDILGGLASGAYQQEFSAELQNIHFTEQEISQYLKMLVYSIDFRSECTVTHTINTVVYSGEIARKMHLSEADQIKIYYGALLHDLGKISIPLEILDSPRGLNEQEMRIMKTHVQITEDIIKGIVDDEICQIAVRHHEKLDGSGYHHGLKGKDLTESQRIVAVADIISALLSKRSYKDVFPKEKILSILAGMKARHQLCPIVCGVVLGAYDEISANAAKTSEPVIRDYTHIMEEFRSLYVKLTKRGLEAKS